MIVSLSIQLKIKQNIAEYNKLLQICQYKYRQDRCEINHCMSNIYILHLSRNEFYQFLKNISLQNEVIPNTYNMEN